MDAEIDITQLLHRLKEGDRRAEEELVPILYRELHRLAARKMRNERRDHTLQPTALVHEVYLRLVRFPKVDWESRVHFLGVAARLMREILVDHHRKHAARMRGGSLVKLQLEDLKIGSPEKSAEILALDEALNRLAERDPRLNKVVELHFFGGLTFAEIATMLKLSERTIKRDWDLARALLHDEIGR
jgi:RNA polymerase sigma factor (TIGR02999 family)